GYVFGVLALAGGRLLSWSEKPGNLYAGNTLRLWSAAGEPLAELRGHTRRIFGALALADGRLLSWSAGESLRLWSAAGEPLAVLRGHEDSVSGALALADGRLLSWSRDNTLRMWACDGRSRDSLHVDAAITVTVPFANQQLFVGDA